MEAPLRILLIEDSPGDARLIQTMLHETDEAPGQTVGGEVEVVDRLAAGLRRLAESPFDVVLLDLGLPDGQGITCVRQVCSQAPEVPVVVFSGRDDRAIAVQAVHEGAQDYLMKGFVSPELLHRALRYAIERKRVEVERSHLLAREREARAQAEAAVQTRDQVLSGVSHDLRTPLAAITLYARTLQERLRGEQPADTGPAVEQAEKIRRAAEDGLGMIDELLDAARLGMGEDLPLERRALDLADLVREAIGEAQETASTNRFSLGVSGTLPGFWDRARLKRVLANVLSNATKYSPPGSTVSISLTRDQCDEREWAVLNVRDEGIGIPTDELPRVFDWYHRGRNASGRRGTGIGLAGARKIVELHGGSIRVHSVEGAGATFEIRLPLDAPGSR